MLIFLRFGGRRGSALPWTAVIVRADDDSIQSMEDLAGKHTANTISSTYATVAESYGADRL